MFGKVFGGRKETENDDEERKEGQKRTKTEEIEPEVSGFRTQKVVRKPITETPHVPVVREAYGEQGGVQGLKWYSDRLKMDEDDDVAEEFFHEVFPNEHAESTREKRSPSLEIVRDSRELRTVRPDGPMRIEDGNVHQSVEAVRRRTNQ